ncbi:WD40 repeat domain-containing protein [Robertkochia aurantiaca]|uniref:WD40 repeat domain-containing protein n=1 Tax=Robertkochia aurantiaca TaxID=2873700 RepID=UPI001CCAC879|nr:WD40 repeat domain-containing protein [Robertkochia sp. 3YJGBD-33]
MLTNLCLLAFLMIGCEQQIKLKEAKQTAINPLSYTDVIYMGSVDTVLASTFDGRISEIINHTDGEKVRVITRIDDEIYSLAYNREQQQIYATTLHSGILVIDAQRGEVLSSLEVKNKWAPYLSYNEEHQILMTADYGNNIYVWKVSEGFNEMPVPDDLAGMSPKGFSGDMKLYFDGNRQMGIWNLYDNNQIEKVDAVGNITALDQKGLVLFLHGDQFRLYDTASDSIVIQKRHPDWPIYVASRDTVFRAPVSLSLTAGAFAKNLVLTSGIDRSIRVWNKDTGEMIDEFLGHRATVSAMDVSAGEDQLVSVDLKGGIRFWNLDSNR